MYNQSPQSPAFVICVLMHYHFANQLLPHILLHLWTFILLSEYWNYCHTMSGSINVHTLLRLTLHTAL